MTPHSSAKFYEIEGELLTLRQIGERLPGMKKKTVSKRVAEYGWRTWAQLRLTTKLGARSPWRDFRKNWLSGGDRQVTPHFVDGRK